MKPIDLTGQYATVGQALYNSGSGDSTYMAPIDLPNHATITKIVVFYYDNYIDGNLEFALTRLPLNEVGGPAIAYFTSSGAEDIIRYAEITTIENPVVDKQQYTYLLQANLPATSNVKLVSARIDYSYPIALPVVTK